MRGWVGGTDASEELVLLFQARPLDTLKREVAAWQDNRNQEETWIDWRLTMVDARVKLQRLLDDNK